MSLIKVLLLFLVQCKPIKLQLNLNTNWSKFVLVLVQDISSKLVLLWLTLQLHLDHDFDKNIVIFGKDLAIILVLHLLKLQSNWNDNFEKKILLLVLFQDKSIKFVLHLLQFQWPLSFIKILLLLVQDKFIKSHNVVKDTEGWTQTQSFIQTHLQIDIKYWLTIIFVPIGLKSRDFTVPEFFNF